MRKAEESTRRGRLKKDLGMASATTTFTQGNTPERLPLQQAGLVPGASMEEVDRNAETGQALPPDRFLRPKEKRIRAERVTAEINAAHDAYRRH